MAAPQHVRTVGKKPSVDKENVQYLAKAVRLLAPRSWTSQGQNCNKCMSFAEVPTVSHTKCISGLAQAPISKCTKVNVIEHL